MKINKQPQLFHTFCLTFFFLVWGTCVLHAERHYFEKDGFAIDLPSSWIEVNAMVLTEQLGEDFSYGFSQSMLSFTVPYILIAVSDTEKLPEPTASELRAAFEGGDLSKLLEGQFSSQLSKVESGGRYDRENKILWIKLRTMVGGNVWAGGMAGIHLTEKGYVMVIAYSRLENFGTYARTFESIIESVELDEGLPYQTDTGLMRSAGIDFTDKRILWALGAFGVFIIVAILKYF